MKGGIVIDVARVVLVLFALILALFLYTDIFSQKDIMGLTLICFVFLALLDSIRISKLKEEVKD